MKEIIAIYGGFIYKLNQDKYGFIFKRDVYGLSGYYNSKEECIEGAKRHGAKIYVEL